MCFPLTYLFNTRSGRDTKLFTLQPNIKTELKWSENAGAESGLGVSVAGVDKHDTTHSFWVCLLGCGSTRNGGSVPQGRVSLCSETSEQNMRYSHRKGSERRSSEIPRGQASEMCCSSLQEGPSRNKNDNSRQSSNGSWLREQERLRVTSTHRNGDDFESYLTMKTLVMMISIILILDQSS